MCQTSMKEIQICSINSSCQNRLSVLRLLVGWQTHNHKISYLRERCMTIVTSYLDNWYSLFNLPQWEKHANSNNAHNNKIIVITDINIITRRVKCLCVKEKLSERHWYMTKHSPQQLTAVHQQAQLPQPSPHMHHYQLLIYTLLVYSHTHCTYIMYI